MLTIKADVGLILIFRKKDFGWRMRRRFDINLQKKRFWLADENRWITLNVSTQGLRLIDKIGIRKVLNRMRADGKKV